MEASSTRPKPQEHFERLIGLISGLLGIISFIRDYQELGFLLLIVFLVAIFLIYRKDYAIVISIPVNNKKELFQLIFQELVIKRRGYIFAILGISVIFLAMHFLYKEVKFVVKGGWVEPINFQYEHGMLPVHLISIDQNTRSLELLRRINPVIYYDDLYSDKAEISFESQDIDICGDDQPCSNTYFGVDDIGLDPKNEFVEPTGNFENHFGDSGYNRFKIENNYTIFLALDACPAKDGCVVRFHFILKPAFSSSSTILTTIYMSYLYNGSDRFNGLTRP